MKLDQRAKIQDGEGFIAALDQSGGSTPKALAAYGVSEDSYSNDEEMFDRVHEMRMRFMTSPSFSSEQILGTILFKATMNRQVLGKDTADFLWEEKGIVPFLKIDNGLKDVENGVQLMKQIPDLGQLLELANDKNIYGTKMRSVVKSFNVDGIASLATQQFEVALEVAKAGLVPIIEPEIDIHAEDKAAIEDILKRELINHLDQLSDRQTVMLKLTLPERRNHYAELVSHPRVIRVAALSGGYTREIANAKLAENNGVIASFSRALASGLSSGQTEDEFDTALAEAITSIYQASIS